MLLSIISNQFRIIYQTKILLDKGYSQKDIAIELGTSPGRIWHISNKTNNYSEENLKKYLLLFADLDRDIKKGIIEKNIGLELLLLKI